MKSIAFSFLTAASSVVAFCGNAGEAREDQGRDEVFTVAHLHETNAQILKRFERLEVPNATVKLIRTWMEPQYTWARLTYVTTGQQGESVETSMFIACHSHGTSFGCHRKTEAGSLEPVDGPADQDDDHDHDGDHDDDDTSQDRNG